MGSPLPISYEQARADAILAAMGGDPGLIRWGTTALTPRPVSLVHARREYVQQFKRLVAAARDAQVPIRVWEDNTGWDLEPSKFPIS